MAWKWKNFILNPIYYLCGFTVTVGSPVAMPFITNTNFNSNWAHKRTYSQNGIQHIYIKCTWLADIYLNYDIVENIKQFLISIRFQNVAFESRSMNMCACKLCNELINAINSLTNCHLWLSIHLIYSFILQQPNPTIEKSDTSDLGWNISNLFSNMYIIKMGTISVNWEKLNNTIKMCFEH